MPRRNVNKERRETTKSQCGLLEEEEEEKEEERIVIGLKQGGDVVNISCKCSLSDD